MAENCGFYCLSFQNPERKNAMQNRFDQLGVDVFMYPGVTFDDERIAGRDIVPHVKRCWSFTYGHFDLLREFYFNSEKEYGIFCEDDIYIRKDLIEQLPKIIENFKELNLDLLLLGYLTTHVISKSLDEFNLKKESNSDHPFGYYNYPDSVWGLSNVYDNARSSMVFNNKVFAAVCGHFINK